MGRGVAVVTGGTAGLGRAIVRELAGRGWDVGVLARGADGLAGTVADVERAGRRALGVQADVADDEAVEAAAERIEAELGPIEVWVNNAMVSVFAEFSDIRPADFERAVQVDFFGYVNGTRAALRRMRPRDGGTIVQVGSALGHRAIPLQSAYCSAKHAIVGLNESLVAELRHARSKVTVSEVDMPGMNTPQFEWVRSDLPLHAQPVPPIYQPEICAKVVVDTAEHPRRRTWVGEPTVLTVIGNRVASRVADRYLARTAYSGQQTSSLPKPVGDNLWEPLPGDRGAHGPFDSRSLSTSPQIWAIRHRPVVVVAGLGALAAGVAALRLLPRRAAHAAKTTAGAVVGRGTRTARRRSPMR